MTNNAVVMMAMTPKLTATRALKLILDPRSVRAFSPAIACTSNHTRLVADKKRRASAMQRWQTPGAC